MYHPRCSSRTVSVAYSAADRGGSDEENHDILAVVGAGTSDRDAAEYGVVHLQTFRRFAPLAFPSLLLLLVGLSAALLGSAASGWSLKWSGKSPWRALWSIRSSHNAHKVVSTAECVIDTSLATTYLGRAGLEIDEAGKICPEFDALSKESAEKYREAEEAFHSLLEPFELEFEENETHAGSHPFRVHPPPVPQLVPVLDRVGGPSAAASALVARADQVLADTRQQLEGAGMSLDNPQDPQQPGPPGGRRLSGGGGGGGGGGHHENVSHELVEQALEKAETFDEMVEAAEESKELRSRAELARRECAASIAGVFASFSYSVSYIAAVTAECPGHHRYAHYCTSDIARILGSVSELAAAGSAISAQCTSLSAFIRLPPETINRRLSSNETEIDAGEAIQKMFELLEKAHDKKEEIERQQEEEKAWARQRQFTQAVCAFDITQTVLILARLGVEVNAAYHHCRVGNAKNCGGTISGIFAAVSLAASWISGATSQCADRVNRDSICAQAVTQLAAGISELTAGVFVLHDSCMHLEEGGEAETFHHHHLYNKKGQEFYFGDGGAGEAEEEEEEYAAKEVGAADKAEEAEVEDAELDNIAAAP